MGYLMETVCSTLEDACDQYAGRTLIVQPHSGYGWVHQEGKPFMENGGVPTPFRLNVLRIYLYKGERRGVLARITEPGFLYDGYWLVSMTRHKGIWNFTDRPATYNLLICPEEPVEGKVEDSLDQSELWPVWHLQGYPHVSGFGRIAETLQWCADYDAKREEEATQQGGGNEVFRFMGTLVLRRGTK